MIIGSFNIRRLGSRIKKRKVREFVSSNHLDFLLIEETKLSTVSEGLCHYLWGNPFYD
jgi:exonuclease III